MTIDNDRTIVVFDSDIGDYDEYEKNNIVYASTESN